ncbi:hypothetical protein ABPG75_001481 [Micractinium tetrahymenae]
MPTSASPPPAQRGAACKRGSGPLAEPPLSRAHPACSAPPRSLPAILQLLKGKGTASKSAAKPAVKKAAPAKKSSGTERSGGAGYRQYDGESPCPTRWRGERGPQASESDTPAHLISR